MIPGRWRRRGELSGSTAWVTGIMLSCFHPVVRMTRCCVPMIPACKKERQSEWRPIKTNFPFVWDMMSTRIRTVPDPVPGYILGIATVVFVGSLTLFSSPKTLFLSLFFHFLSLFSIITLLPMCVQTYDLWHPLPLFMWVCSSSNSWLAERQVIVRETDVKHAFCPRIPYSEPSRAQQESMSRKSGYSSCSQCEMRHTHTYGGNDSDYKDRE